MTKKELEQDIKALKQSCEEFAKENSKLKNMLKGYAKYNDLQEAIDQHDRNIVEDILFNVLLRLYMQPYNKESIYSHMSRKGIIKAQHKVLAEIEKDYNINFESMFTPYNLMQYDGD